MNVFSQHGGGDGRDWKTELEHAKVKTKSVETRLATKHTRLLCQGEKKRADLSAPPPVCPRVYVRV